MDLERSSRDLIGFALPNGDKSQALPKISNRGIVHGSKRSRGPSNLEQAL
jgi:hypothetical protein